MTNLRTSVLLFAALAPLAAWAFSDGYLEWTSVEFEDAAGWRVHLVESGPYVNLLQGKVEVVVRPNISGYEYFPLGAVRLYPVRKS